ncbi:MAG: alpha/beta hydrolase [Bradymonadales bacterium]|nr:alpha/beta hydrolase [Bradymonadales bacterium]
MRESGGSHGSLPDFCRYFRQNCPSDRSLPDCGKKRRTHRDVGSQGISPGTPAATHVALALCCYLFILANIVGCLSFHQGPMPLEPADATFLTVDGVRIRYLDIGEGPPVVLLHGYASSLETWETVLPDLSRTHRTIALDLKGFGWTDRPPGDYSPLAQADLVLALLDRLGLNEVSVVAHSWGSSVALAMALRAPDRIDRLALYDAWVYEDQTPLFIHWASAPVLGEILFGLFYGERPDERMALAFYDPERMTQDLADRVGRALDRPGTRAAALATARDRSLAELEERYRTIRQPVLLLWGREDTTTPLPYGERLVRDLPGAELVVYPRCGHFPMIEATAASNRDLLRFLADRGGSR